MKLNDQWKTIKRICAKHKDGGKPRFFAVEFPAQRKIHKTYFMIRKCDDPHGRFLKVVDHKVIDLKTGEARGFSDGETLSEAVEGMMGIRRVRFSRSKVVHSVRKDGIMTTCGFVTYYNPSVEFVSGEVTCKNCKRSRKK